MSLEEIGLDYINEALIYDKEDGKLYWRKDRPIYHFGVDNLQKYWSATYGGKEAGTVGFIKNNTYKIISIKKFRTTNHRVIWYMNYGYLPEAIDHIDGNGLNNKLENLRESCLKRNPKNQKLHKTNKTGVSGISYDSKRNTWRVFIGKKHLGTYHDFFEACCVRISNQNKMGYGDRDRL